jgi:hypothetical protein
MYASGHPQIAPTAFDQTIPARPELTSPTPRRQPEWPDLQALCLFLVNDSVDR